MALHRAIHALPPPSLKRGPRRPPGREQPPPPPQGTAALGSPRPALGGLSGFAPEPARPFHAPPHQPQPRGPPGLPRAGPQPPGTRAPEPRCPAPPAPPVSLRRGPSRSGSAARGRCGAPPRLHQDSPPWMTLGGIRPRRAGCGPHRRPRPRRHLERPGLPGRLWPAPAAPPPGRPHGDALRLSSPHPRPPRARTHPPAHSPPPPPRRARRAPTPPHSPAPPLSGSEAPEVGCRSRRRAAAIRTRGPPARGGCPGLAPLPPATRIMALRVSYLPPYAPCVMAASGLCLPHTEIARGGRRPLGGAPRTPAAAPPDWRVVGPAGARFEPPPPSIHLPRPPVPPLSPTPTRAARPARAVRARAAP